VSKIEKEIFGEDSRFFLLFLAFFFFVINLFRSIQIQPIDSPRSFFFFFLYLSLFFKNKASSFTNKKGDVLKKKK